MTEVVAGGTDKSALRRRMRALRLVADQKQGPEAAGAMAALFMPQRAAVGIGPQTVVAGYWPIITEIDIRPVLAKLDALQVPLALPVVADRHSPLVFRGWCPEDEVQEADLGTFVPPAGAAEVRPHVLFVPLLAFDRRGARLGQGGGYYDRTLAALRATGGCTAIGVGYALQEVDHVPVAAGDEPLDWVLTETALVKVVA